MAEFSVDKVRIKCGSDMVLRTNLSLFMRLENKLVLPGKKVPAEKKPLESSKCTVIVQKKL